MQCGVMCVAAQVLSKACRAHKKGIWGCWSSIVDTSLTNKHAYKFAIMAGLQGSSQHHAVDFIQRLGQQLVDNNGNDQVNSAPANCPSSTG